MKGKTVLIVLVAVLATAASTFVATRAITGTVSSGRSVTASAETDAGEIWAAGPETALSVGDRIGLGASATMTNSSPP